MGLSLKLFIRPAMALVGKLLQKMDKNDTGIDDAVGEKLVALSKNPDLDGILSGLDLEGLNDESDDVNVRIIGLSL